MVRARDFSGTSLFCGLICGSSQERPWFAVISGVEVTRERMYLAMLAGWVLLTLTLTSIPNPEFGPTFPGADTIAHLGFYGVAGFLFALWRRESGRGAAGAGL